MNQAICLMILDSLRKGVHLDAPGPWIYLGILYGNDDKIRIYFTFTHSYFLKHPMAFLDDRYIINVSAVTREDKQLL